MRVKIFVAALLSAAAAGLASPPGTSPAETRPQGGAAQVKEVAGYREWARMTPQPVKIDFPSVMG